MSEYIECEAEFIDGSWYYCGCHDCQDAESREAEEWQEGECDHCFGETVNGPLGPLYCACAIGQGADESDCVCGPESTHEDAREGAAS